MEIIQVVLESHVRVGEPPRIVDARDDTPPLFLR